MKHLSRELEDGRESATSIWCGAGEWTRGREGATVDLDEVDCKECLRSVMAAGSAARSRLLAMVLDETKDHRVTALNEHLEEVRAERFVGTAVEAKYPAADMPLDPEETP